MQSAARSRPGAARRWLFAAAVLSWTAPLGAAGARSGGPAPPDRKLLDAPLLFVKRHAYMAAHIYDDYYTWHPGGGIYVIENPADPPERHRVRAVIDPTTPETLGVGVYRDPELSWDARRVLFAFKGAADGGTSIYEIGIDGRGLRRLTDPGRECEAPMPVRAIGGGRHDVTPCYLPDGRIAFTSTRQRGRVPCFNSEVDTLHVMDPPAGEAGRPGADIRPISVNNVNEFDPAVLPDGRILYGRWEYVDKTALYMQSLWTIFPDGTNETALFGNNLAKPTAILDARPVPGTHLIVASLTPHNGQAVGAIAMIDPCADKNDLGAITNFTPEYPTEMDQGLRRGPCDPWPLSRDVVLISNNARGHGVIEMIDRRGGRLLVHAEKDISCYAPMLVKPQDRPPVIAGIAGGAPTGRFLVADVYQGLAGVRRGEVTHLRVIEETARTSGIPPGGRWWNQAFLVSWQGGYVVKNILGTVPVDPDGSAYFEAPAGRALYFQALDADGRLVQSMRTFIQAAPGTTRSCIGCHEHKMTAMAPAVRPQAQRRPPDRPREESWGSGYLDYSTMVQPILDAHCVRCHGGDGGIAGGIDLSGGWTWAFNISYETLIRNTLVGFLNCHNSSVRTSVVLPPRTHGSGAAPLGELLVKGHHGRIGKLTRAQRDLLMAWMDTNCNYYGTWNWTPQATCPAVLDAGRELSGRMRQAGCTTCHAPTVGCDWINLRRPERSRILRAPLAAGGRGAGLAWCRDRKAPTPPGLVTQRSQPPDVFRPARRPPPDPSGRAVTTFASADDEHYQAMLAIIRRARQQALARPRVDMPGAEIIPGDIRRLVPMEAPDTAPPLAAEVDAGGVVRLTWPRTAETIGLTFEIHRGPGGDQPVPGPETLLKTTTLFAFTDELAPAGRQDYALVAVADGRRSGPARASVSVPPPAPPPAPVGLTARGEPGQVVLTWQAPSPPVTCHVYRAPAGSGEFARLTDEPVAGAAYADDLPGKPAKYTYQVRAVSRRGVEGPPSAAVTAASLPLRREPVFVAFAGTTPLARRAGGEKAPVHLHAGAKVAEDDGALDVTAGGHATIGHLPEFDLGRRFSVELRVRIDKLADMPVIASCGFFSRQGWFLQAFNGRWRWHLGGVSCDGGRVRVGAWVRLAATYDGREAVLYQDGRRVAAVGARPDVTCWTGPLVIGQYATVQPSFQTFGRIAGIKLYRRALRPSEVAAAGER